MVLELSALFAADGELPFHFTLDVSDACFSGAAPVKDVSVDGCVKSRAGVVEMTGSASFCYSRPCDRCAKTVDTEMKVPFFYTLVSERSGEEDDELITVSNMKLDPAELIREDVILSFPGSYLCKADCKGLCPVCGADLNTESCLCEKKDTDPRLEALKKLLD